ncbi:MAG: putative DNA binding domain-containing protein [Candidatus Sumerlaeota bacterium]|nr:putative DNA binding domain-containing protein [Candidatus Sumerlaeota bacterium]
MDWADDPAKIGRVVCAFANGLGGALVIGGVGGSVLDSEQKSAHLREELQKRIAPAVAAAMRSVEIGKRHLILIDVPSGYDLPYTFDRQIFIRTEAETQAADGLEARQLLLRRAAFGPRWERQIATGIGLDDLDTKLILRVAREAEGGRLFVFRSKNDVWDILCELDLAEGNLIRNSAYALFGKQPDKRFPQMRMRAVAYKGTEQEKLADSRMIGGNLYQILEKSFKFLEAHTPISSEIPRQGLRREQKAAYPMPAIREALLNAIIHRDYAPANGGASIATYADRIEIWNIGDLPEGMKINELKQIHASRPRNPDIAHLFMLHGQIERIGSGTRRIVREFRAMGLPEPEWRQVSGGIMLILPQGRRKGITASAEDLNTRQRKILNSMKTGQTIRLSDYIQRLPGDVKERQARNDLKNLADMGFMRQRGKARLTEYVRTDKPLS